MQSLTFARADITGRKQAQAAVTRLASEDALTGFRNRRLFREELEKYVQPRYLSQGFALLLLDLHRVKIVNAWASILLSRATMTKTKALAERLIEALSRPFEVTEQHINHRI